jgi:hypothetical protein
MGNSTRRISRVAGLIVALTGLFCVSLPARQAHAATGDILADFVPGGATGNGRGLAFDGVNLYYTIVGDPNIYKVTTAGALLATIPVSQVFGTIQGGPLAWDGSALWTMNYADPSFTLYRVSPADGSILSSCNIATQNPSHPAVTSSPRNIGESPDGLDWTGSTLWVSSEVFSGNWVVQVDTNCNILSAFNPPANLFDAGSLGGTSGVALVGGKLWHPTFNSDETAMVMFQTDTSGATTGLSFVTPRITEDLAFDSLTFAPKCSLWGNEATLGTNHLTAYEIPCASGPVLTVPGPLTVTEEMPFTFTVSATDADGPFPLVFSASNLPAGATFTPDGTSAVFAWTPNSAQGGPNPYFVDFTVSDGQLSDTKTVEITVNDTLVDTDGDGVPDSQDNCPNAYNPTQADVCHNSPQTVSGQSTVTPPGSPTGPLNLTMTITFNGGTTGTNVLPPDLFNTICRVINNATGQEVPQAGVPEGPPIDLTVNTTNPNGSLIFVAPNTSKTLSTSFNLKLFYFPNLVEGSYTLNCDYVNFAHIPIPAPDDPTIWTGLIPTQAQTVFNGQYTFSGFLSPIPNQPFSQGRTVPVKFSLKDSQGAFVTTATGKVFVQRLTNGQPTGPVIPATPSGGSSGNVARYDFTNQQYVFNMNTKSMAVGFWRISVLLDDGRTKTVDIDLTK